MAKRAVAKKAPQKMAEAPDVDIDLGGIDAELPDQEDDAEEGETLQSKARKKESIRSSKKAPKLKQEWYEFKRGNTYDPKKGLKLVRYRLYSHGAISELIGHEKRIPKSFLRKLRDEGKLKE